MYNFTDVAFLPSIAAADVVVWWVLENTLRSHGVRHAMGIVLHWMHHVLRP